MAETIIKSAFDEDRITTIATVEDGVVIYVGDESHPTRTGVGIYVEDFPAVFAALKKIINEIRETESI